MELATLRNILDYDPTTGAFRWRENRPPVFAGDRAGWLSEKGYRYICVDGERFRAGRLVWFYVHGRWPVDQIDHINRVRDDDRLENLREATAYVNTHNRFLRRSNRLGKQISLRRDSGRWRASLWEKGRTIALGCFATREAAEAAWTDAASRLWTNGVGAQVAQ